MPTDLSANSIAEQLRSIPPRWRIVAAAAAIVLGVGTALTAGRIWTRPVAVIHRIDPPIARRLHQDLQNTLSKRFVDNLPPACRSRTRIRDLQVRVTVVNGVTDRNSIRCRPMTKSGGCECVEPAAAATRFPDGVVEYSVEFAVHL